MFVRKNSETDSSAPNGAPDLHSESAETGVAMRGVEKTYDGETLVVRPLDLDVRRGEFLTLLGPSGSGKTTLLMLVAGFETPSSGDILLNGHSIKALPPHKRDIGVVFQNYALFPHMTVGENLAFPLSVRKVSKPEVARRVKRALEMVRLPGYDKRRPQQLSGGQQQRVALARALVFEPQLVLLDEPLGALDKQLREQMQIEIKHLHQELGVTMIYVTHDQSEALTMSDRIAVFHQGAIQQLSTPTRLYEDPENSFVANFIGENNRMPGRVMSKEGDTCRVALTGGVEVQARAVKAGGAGSSTLLSLRPERVLLNPPPESCPNRFPARVLELIYLGDHMRVRLALGGNEDFIIKIPNTADTSPLHPQQDVTVGWHTRDCKALDPM